MLLTRVETALRTLKSPLMERPIFHHLERRVQTHIFLCVLAYHLLVAIEKRGLDQGRISVIVNTLDRNAHPGPVRRRESTHF